MTNHELDQDRRRITIDHIRKKGLAKVRADIDAGTYGEMTRVANRTWWATCVAQVLSRSLIPVLTLIGTVAAVVSCMKAP